MSVRSLAETGDRIGSVVGPISEIASQTSRAIDEIAQQISAMRRALHRDGIDMLKLCFDQLHAKGAATGRIMNVGLHPHVMGQPHRITALREFID